MAQKYETVINLDIDNAHTRVIRLVGRDKRVLELGCATGYMSQVLTERFGCTVTGVELNADAARQAREFCARVIEGDCDAIDWSQALGDERFDVILAADVLEHMRNPARVLAMLHRHLAEGGYLVASIPNFAHASVLVELLQGRFSYQPLGLLDDTHIRFFTRDSIYECFDQAGYAMTRLERVIVPPEQTEFRTDLSSFSPEVRALVESREESHTYQFILTARPVSGRGALDPAGFTLAGVGRDRTPSPALDPHLRRLDGVFDEADVGPLDGVLQAVNARMAFLESGRQHQTELIGRLREQLARSEIHIGSLTSELRSGQDEIVSLRDELESALRKRETPPGTIEELRRALEVKARRLVEERLRLGDMLEMAERERDRLAAELRERDDRIREQASIDREVAQLAGHIEQLTTHDQQLSVHNQQLTVRNQELITHNHQLTVHCGQLTSRIDDYERSRSWRCTAPLRAALRVLGRLKRARS